MPANRIKEPAPELVLEVNQTAINDPTRPLAKLGVHVTPPLNGTFWLMRVPLTPNQAIVTFPKMGSMGVGFQVEKEDWNTNLPSSCAPGEIYDHIKVNAGSDKSITRYRCIKAIRMLQNAIEVMKAASRESAVVSHKRV